MRTEQEIVGKIIEAIVKDISDRSGLGNCWEDIDDETQLSIQNDWRLDIEKILSSPPQDKPAESKEPAESNNQEVRYLTDNRDLEHRNELVISLGGNGDIYVAVVPEGSGCMGKSVRICTSGGASSKCPGLTSALIAAFRAIKNSSESKPEVILDRSCKTCAMSNAGSCGVKDCNAPVFSSWTPIMPKPKPQPETKELTAESILKKMNAISCPNASRDMNPYYTGCDTCQFTKKCLNGWENSIKLRILKECLAELQKQEGRK